MSEKFDEVTYEEAIIAYNDMVEDFRACRDCLKKTVGFMITLAPEGAEMFNLEPPEVPNKIKAMM